MRLTNYLEYETPKQRVQNANIKALCCLLDELVYQLVDIFGIFPEVTRPPFRRKSSRHFRLCAEIANGCT